jgi:hypothetical protein
LAVIVSTDTPLSYLQISKPNNSHAPNHGHAPIADLQLDAFCPADLVELSPKALAEGAEDTAAPRLSPLGSGLKKQEILATLQPNRALWLFWHEIVGFPCQTISFAYINVRKKEREKESADSNPNRCISGQLR